MATVHIYRWDLDRTYLETEIHSTLGLIRAGLERASDKRTVQGARELLIGLQEQDPEAQLFVLSGSPRQLRRVLSEKLALDGVRVDRFVLKDNLRNLLRGRLRAVREQVGYKLPELLEDRAGQRAQVTETLFGDDAETDAVIYAVYAELVAGRMDEEDLVRLLEQHRAYPDALAKAVSALGRIDREDAVEDIFIRIDRGVPLEHFRVLGPKVYPVRAWWQAALLLHLRGRLGIDAVRTVAIASGLEERPARAGELVRDAVERGFFTADDVLGALREAELERVREEAEQFLDVPPASPEDVPGRPDYHAFLNALRSLH